MGLDPKGNYINQGSYKMYDTDGQVIREGDFVEGKQQGKWIRRFQKDDGHLFSPSTDDDYAGPFTSEATFLDGQLHGMWTIKDSAGQKIVEWSFDKGTRSGPWTLWHSNGKKRIEAIYRNGVINGDVIEYDRDEKEIARTTYSDGKHLQKVMGWYTLGQKQYEGFNLHADNLMEASYDWWRSTVSTTPAPAGGPDQKQGTWVSWYRNGNKETEAHYDHDVRIGKFQWWYENGQPQAEGSYENGKKIGAWITWHPNGQKESMGEYQNDQLVGRFSHWDSDGKLLEAKGDPRQFYSNQPQTQQPQPVRTGSTGFGFRNR
jgi:antitoxin component YwqK of YwqJK toxin-antitoxin module